MVTDTRPGLDHATKQKLAKRIKPDSYYTDGINLYIVDDVYVINGCVILRDCVSDMTYCVSMQDFRLFWLVSERSVC